MSEEERDLEMHDPEAEITTEEPAPRAPEAPKKWAMPEPVFRQTSGYLPQGYEKRFPAPAADAAELVPPPAPDPFSQTYVGGSPGLDEELARVKAEAKALRIEEQPDVPEVLVTDESPAPAASAIPEGPASRFSMIAIVLLAVAGFALVFLAIVGYLFRSDILRFFNYDGS